MFTKEALKALVDELYDTVPGNAIALEIALKEELAGVRMFDRPIVGFGSADDPLFWEFKDPKAVGPWHLSPREWFAQGRTVVSAFFPFTEDIRAGNRAQKDGPSFGWLHSRIEGQIWLFDLLRELSRRLDAEGIKNCVPSLDPRWFQVRQGKEVAEYDCADGNTFGSAWSERHAAFVCGLGTFGLSKGMITRKGIAGRFVSIIIDEELEPDGRPYTDIYEWCVNCGACARRCPAGAISLEKGKDHNTCMAFLHEMGKKYSPRYGCGLCQTAVPCENRIPGAAKDRTDI